MHGLTDPCLRIAVSALTLRSSIHFELICTRGVRQGSGAVSARGYPATSAWVCVVQTKGRKRHGRKDCLVLRPTVPAGPAGAQAPREPDAQHTPAG